MRVKKAEELLVSGENRIGFLCDISEKVSSAGVNILAISAYAYDNKAFFRMVTSDNDKAKSVLSGLGCEIADKQVVSVEAKDRVGELKEMTSRLKDSGIDLKYIYGTALGNNESCLLIFSSDNDDKAVDVLR